MFRFRQFGVGLSVVLSVAIYGELSALAVRLSASTSEIHQPHAQNYSTSLAQTNADLCRRVFQERGLVVRERPTPNSPIIGGVAFNETVTLVRNFQGIRGPGGRTWIEIVAPLGGFISNGYPDGLSNLVLCSGSPAPQPGTPEKRADLCRRIDFRAAPRGVVVRENPSRFSERVGGVPTGQEVYLVEDYQLIPDPNNEPRNWVEIFDPVEGYISANTLVMCR
ncbi:MAG: SH3 domain-containing protein [Microcoleaceae cyanobacterium]